MGGLYPAVERECCDKALKMVSPDGSGVLQQVYEDEGAEYADKFWADDSTVTPIFARSLIIYIHAVIGKATHR